MSQGQGGIKTHHMVEKKEGIGQSANPIRLPSLEVTGKGPRLKTETRGFKMALSYNGPL